MEITSNDIIGIPAILWFVLFVVFATGFLWLYNKNAERSQMLLDKREDKQDALNEKVSETLSELQKITSIHETEIENIKDSIHPSKFRK